MSPFAPSIRPLRPVRFLRGIASFAAVLLLTSTFGCAEQSGSGMASTAQPVARFTQDRTSGPLALVVTFEDQSTGEFETRRWDFGNGETSDQANPTVTYTDEGVYDVSLTVNGRRGASTRTMPALIEVRSPPVAGFTCLQDTGLAPFTPTCLSSATGADTTEWSFTQGTTTLTSNAVNPSVTLEDPGTWTVTQTVRNAGGEDTLSQTLEVVPFSIAVTRLAGSGPGPVRFEADTGGLSGLLETWFVDGAFVGGSQTLVYSFAAPGTYTVRFSFGSGAAPGDPILVGDVEVEVEVGYGPAVAGFSVDVEEGPGPLDVAFSDESTGEIDHWRWDFGDGTICEFPAPEEASPGDPDVCSSASPSHTYADIGRYDVTLTVTGPGAADGDPPVVDTVRLSDAAWPIVVTIFDPSFEAQAADAAIDAPWTALRPSGATATADHVALALGGGGVADGAMPTDGTRWASLDGLGTDGSEAADVVENGLRQDFVRPRTATVLEFDYAFLFSEPPLGVAVDAMTATVSDGTTTVEIPSARAAITSPYAGGSSRYPSLDGSVTRMTPVRTASLDLATAFPGADPDTEYTLTIRLANAANGFRSPRAYVDHVRFVEPAPALVADFSVPDPIVAGEFVELRDETCPDPAGTGCLVPTSWRWDFGTGGGAILPAATGSAAQHPIYAFPAAGDYDVTLEARRADQVDSVTMTVSVLEAPTAVPVQSSPSPASVGMPVVFVDGSSVDPSDTIVAWLWDFGGFGTSTLQDPAPVTFNQVGTWPVRLTITTASGLTDTAVLDVVVE